MREAIIRLEKQKQPIRETAKTLGMCTFLSLSLSSKIFIVKHKKWLQITPRGDNALILYFHHQERGRGTTTSKAHNQDSRKYKKRRPNKQTNTSPSLHHSLSRGTSFPFHSRRISLFAHIRPQDRSEGLCALKCFRLFQQSNKNQNRVRD